MLTLAKKKSFNDWIELGDGVSMKIDYPTRAQERQLLNYLLNEKEVGEVTPSKLDYMRYFLKYTIKDWKGVKDEDGQEIPCKVVNGELETSLWEDLIADVTQSIDTWVKVSSELQFDVYDKKKFGSVENSKQKEN